MVICCDCGRNEVNCVCDNNQFPMEWRNPNWKAEKAAYDKAKEERIRNKKLQKEIHELKVKLDKMSSMFSE
jgi:hypothetical protein